MITRPLDLASKLRSEPRSFDVYFYVNAGLLVLFFSLFGSRFVLAPGLGVNFKIPVLPTATADAAMTTSVISISASGQIFTYDGTLEMGQLRDWLKKEAGRYKRPVMLIRASEGVPVSSVYQLYSACTDAGFASVQVAAEGSPH